jgi:hypothetical protein
MFLIASSPTALTGIERMVTYTVSSLSGLDTMEEIEMCGRPHIDCRPAKIEKEEYRTRYLQESGMEVS